MTQLEETIQLEDLDYYWMDNGLPVFMANRDDICDVVESFGFSIYYLLTNNVKTTTSTTKTTTTTTSGSSAPLPVNQIVTSKSMQLYKVVNNFVGRTVSLSNEPFGPEFIKVEEEALYNMPPIPHIIIEKLDQFFRLVDAQHGTESIVMLTYDMTKEGPDGWGILVPNQVNTAVHCNYDPDSIAQIKPDDVMIVGSVHSHPGMAAYASGTDHKDQADFDGLHITYGWQKSVNNGATQYHIEMQMAGKAYTLSPDDVFEDWFVEKSPDPEVVEWTDKVKKVSPPSPGGAAPIHSLATTSGTGPVTATTRVGQTDKDKSFNDYANIKKKTFEKLGFNLDENCIVIAELNESYGYNTCPLCSEVIDEFELFNGYCDTCFMPVTTRDSSYEDIIVKLSYYCDDFRIDRSCSVYIWKLFHDNTESVTKIFENLSEEFKKQMDITEQEYGENLEEKSICCETFVLADGKSPCNCVIKVTPDDLVDFDVATKTVNLYSDDAVRCSGCEHFYDPSCPMIREYLFQWVDDRTTNVNIFEGTISDYNCNDYTPYQRVNEMTYNMYNVGEEA